MLHSSNPVNEEIFEKVDMFNEERTAMVII